MKRLQLPALALFAALAFAQDQPSKPSADQQSNQPADVQITRMIRRDITKSDTFSVKAKNVKIITISGKVTLRGTVDTAGEKSAIEAIAKKHAGNDRVDNQLEIPTAK